MLILIAAGSKSCSTHFGPPLDGHRETRERFDGAGFWYAKSVGLMFDPVSASHAELVANLAAATAQIPMRRVTNAFVASLSTRQPHWRSAMGTLRRFATFDRMPRPKASVRW